VVRTSKAHEYLEVRGREIFNLPMSVNFREMLVSFSTETFERRSAFIRCGIVDC